MGQAIPANSGRIAWLRSSVGGYGYTTLRDIKLLDYKLLGWYRTRDARPHHLDHALCWAKTSTDHGVRWVLAHVATNPKVTTSGTSARLPWTLYVVSDTPNGWLHFYATPPKNQDLYRMMTFFKFQPEDGTEVYDSQLLTNNWESALGEKPEKTFPTASPGTGTSRAVPDTIRSSTAAGSD